MQGWLLFLFFPTTTALATTIPPPLTPPSCKMSKTIKEIFPKPRPHWVGDGFFVHPVFGSAAFTSKISPFLMFDYATPKEFPPTTKQLGVGRHPHRGFSTITLALAGEIEHSDDKGHRDVIRQGDVQWMRAARGIVHDEFHSTSFRDKGGTMEMCQLWLDLPKDRKMDDPAYQAILDSDVPRVPFDGGYVRVVAGTHRGVTGPADSCSPVELFHVVVGDDQNSAAEVDIELTSPRAHNALLFAARGTLTLQDHETNTKHHIQESQVALLNRDGDAVKFTASPDAQIILMGGLPLDQKIVNHGPFVMTSQEDIEQAFDDYYSGNF
mmetsp:Transcript_36074/g.115499  ORF Transcript_36074/g.115499 Transcript_36074/m.115499 type:complete len:324 (+) Transcript_36074:120-1091(+)